jgi:glutathione S-transferase
MAHELGIEFEQVPIDFSTDAKSLEYLAINPNGRVPALVDGDFVLWESMAINLYLAKRHGGALAPQTLAEEGHVLQWSFWAMTECDRAANTLTVHRFLRPEDQRDERLAAEAAQALEKPLFVLDCALDGKDYLVGGRFTVADLNVASVLSSVKLAKMSLEPYPHVDRWLRACLPRPAQKKALASGN